MDESQALELLQEILSRPEFQAERTRYLWEIWRESLEAWLYDLVVGSALAVAGAASGREGWLGLAVAAVSLTLLMLVGIFVARAIGLSVTREAATTRAEAAARRERSDRLWRQAQQLAATGELREAVRALYLAAFYALDEHAVVRVQEGLTNREHLVRLTSDHPEISPVFGELVERYDSMRYGGAEVTRQAFEEVRRLAERTRALAA